MFNKCLLMLTLITSVLVNNKNYLGYLGIKNNIYQEYKSICYNQIYYLKEINKTCFNFNNIDSLFISKINENKNLSIYKVNYIKEDSYIYPIYTQEITYILNLEIGFKSYKFKLISNLEKKGNYEI